MSNFTESQQTFLNELFSKLNGTFTAQSNEIKEEVKNQISDLKTEVHSVLQSYEDKISKLEKKNCVLQEKVADLDRKSRKNNLVIHGIKKTEDIEESTVKLFKDILTIDISPADINDIHYLGAKSNPKTPILVELLSYQKKLLILKNCSKLRERGIFISHDRSTEDRAINKILLKHHWQARQKGLQAHIKGHKLLVGNDLYTVAELENQDCSDSPHEKHNSAPPTPNPLVRQKRLFDEFGLEENDIQQESKKCRPPDTNTTNIKTVTPRVLRSNSTASEKHT